MWRRKTVFEITADEQASAVDRKKLGLPIFFASLMGFVAPLCKLLIGSARSMRPPLPFAKAVASLPPIALVLFPISLVVLIYSRRKGNWEVEPECLICTSCHHPQVARQGGCERCGGTLESINHWRWVGE
jgi:hypothetical protein